MKQDLHTFYRYFPISKRDREWGLYVTTVGESQIKPGSSYPPSGHPKGYDFEWSRGRILHEYTLVYISGGRGYFESRRGFRKQIEPGHVILLFPEVWHRYMPDIETGWCEHWIGFDGDLARRWHKNRFISPDNPVFKSNAEDILLAMFTGIVQAIRINRPALQQVMAGTTCDVLGLLYSAQQSVLSGNTKSQMAIEKAITRMQAELASEMDMPALARELGVSYSWFRSTFVHHTGLSPHRYLSELRLMRARNLLSETELTVKQIAVQVGVEDEHYFSRLFHKKIGFTPSDWRERSRPGI